MRGSNEFGQSNGANGWFSNIPSFPLSGMLPMLRDITSAGMSPTRKGKKLNVGKGA